MQTRSDCFALHDNVLLYIMLLCKGEHLTESRKPTSMYSVISKLVSSIQMLS